MDFFEQFRRHWISQELVSRLSSSLELAPSSNYYDSALLLSSNSSAQKVLAENFFDTKHCNLQFKIDEPESHVEEEQNSSEDEPEILAQQRIKRRRGKQRNKKEKNPQIPPNDNSQLDSENNPNAETFKIETNEVDPESVAAYEALTEEEKYAVWMEYYNNLNEFSNHQPTAESQEGVSASGAIGYGNWEEIDPSYYESVLAIPLEFTREPEGESVSLASEVNEEQLSDLEFQSEANEVEMDATAELDHSADEGDMEEEFYAATNNDGEPGEIDIEEDIEFQNMENYRKFKEDGQRALNDFSYKDQQDILLESKQSNDLETDRFKFYQQLFGVENAFRIRTIEETVNQSIDASVVEKAVDWPVLPIRL